MVCSFTEKTLIRKQSDRLIWANYQTYISFIQGQDERMKLDLALNNVKPKDWYFVLD